MINYNEKLFENIKNNLIKHHQLYKKIRCKAEYLEEILTISFRSTGYDVVWKPGSHDRQKDLVINGEHLSIKSGVLKPRKKKINISGHRLGRFKHDLNKITDYLNKSTDTLCVYDPDKESKDHKYSIALIKKEKFSGLKNKWKKRGGSFIQNNHFNVEFKINISMSDQIWWEVPSDQLEFSEKLI